MEVIKTGTNIATVKISELPQTTDTAGRSTLATNADNESEALKLTQISEAIEAAASAQQAATEAKTAAKDANTLAGVARTAASNAKAAAEDAQTAQNSAETAATEAKDAADSINQDLTGKADLDANKKYLLATQLDPRTGYQTAATMGKGSFSKDSANLKTLSSCTVVSIVETGDDVTTDQCICQQSTHILQRIISGGIGEFYLTKATAAPNTLYEVVSVFDEEANMIKSYVNGAFVNERDASFVPPAERVFYIGETTGRISPFLGKIISVRMFDFAMTDEQITNMWNGGYPIQWRVPDQWRIGLSGSSCVLDLVPESLTPALWRDISGQGNDMLYTPFEGNPKECELSYQTMESEVAKAEKSVMYGMQTGAVMGKGIFQSDASPLLFDGDRTFRVLIKTGSDVTTSQTVFKDKTSGSCMTAYLSGGSLLLYPKGIGTAFFNIRPNKLYECVLVNKGEQAYAYLNNVKKESSVAEDFAQPNTLIAGGIVGAATPFLGTFISLQLFNFAFSNEDAAASWNNGHPELWRVPDEFRAHEIVWPIDNVTESQGVFLENTPSQITTTQNVPQENGFSGAFQRFAGASQAPSVYCNLWIYKYNRAPIRLTIEYRSTSDLYSNYALTKLLLPANTGDAKTVTLDVIAGVYGGAIYAKTTDDTFEIRTIKAEEIGCILDLNAHGLLPTVWRDTSGHGNDLPYSPSSGNPDTCELSYERHGFEEVIIGTAAPTVTPDFIGQKFIDTTNKVTYTAYGTSSAGDWK